MIESGMDRNGRAKYNVEKQDYLRDLRKKEVDTTMDYAENKLKKSALIGATVGGPVGAVWGATISMLKTITTGH